MSRRTPALAAACLGLIVGFAGPAAGREWRVAAGTSLSTPQAALALAAPGDVVRVAAGTYAGPVRVTRGVRLVGEGLPTLDGGGRGTVVVLAAPGASLEGFRVRGSGTSLEKEDAGVLVTAADSRVLGNHFEDVLFGVSVQEAPRAVVARNSVRGKPLDVARRGDAIRVFRSDGSRVEGNRVVDSRDVVLWYSAGLVVLANDVQRSRYGLHFMYCDDAEIRGNVLANNSVGAFLMYSRRLRFLANSVTGNSGPSGYGLGLKDVESFAVRGNRFSGNRVGLFLDGSPNGAAAAAEVTGNLIATGEIGLRLLPTVGGLRVSGNSFVENGEQVEVVGGGDPGANRWDGNSWSDYLGYDADGDGTGDLPYRAERLFESLADRRAELRLFAHAPAGRAIDFAARAFPLVRPRPKLVDPAPRLRLALAVPPPPGVAAERVSPLVAAALLLGSAALLASARLLVRRPAVASAPHFPRRPLTMAATPLVAVHRLGKRFAARAALTDVTFSVRAGEAVALWGANGAGKTTLLRALLGVTSFEGSVSVGGIDVATAGQRARRLVGFVPQEIAFPEMRAGEALRLVARLHGAALDGLPGLAARLGLTEVLDQRIEELSGGCKQRLALAAALAADPPILLLDEPSASLDAAARRDLLALLAELKAAGKTLLFSSHRPEEIVQLADRVLHLVDGRLVADQPPLDLLAEEVGVALLARAAAARPLRPAAAARRHGASAAMVAAPAVVLEGEEVGHGL
jgi:nitrous oxidase accessory protein